MEEILLLEEMRDLMPADADALLLGGPVGNVVALVGDFDVSLKDEDLEQVIYAAYGSMLSCSIVGAFSVNVAAQRTRFTRARRGGSR